METIDLIREFNHLSPVDLDDIMETLRDAGLLNEEGIAFSRDFWETYINTEGE